ncbi:MAG: hypothetical protein GF329_09865 [Candidatus Lokiarchaeota archaeon]|nr:hypothetical protein [Candidatus Lokiarchaeota archaeon]
MSNINSILNEYMDNIIRLLQNLVKSVKENNDLLKKNQEILIETNQLIKTKSSGDPAKIPELSKSLEEIVGHLQKGVQSVQLNSILEDIKGIMNKLGYTRNPSDKNEQQPEPKLPTSNVAQEIKNTIQSQNKDDDEDHVVKPSSFY